MASSPLMALSIASGAIPGALCRYYLTLIFTQKLGRHFPYATLVINLSGALLMGFCTTLFQFMEMSPYFSALVNVGFLGSYTTFSTYQLDSSNLIRRGNYKRALLYWAGSPILGFLCVEAGLIFARQF